MTPTNPDAHPSGLHTAIAEVMAGLGRLDETGRNQQQGYEYVTEADIFDAVRNALGERGVTIVQSHGEIVSLDTVGQTRSGQAIREAVIAFDFTLTHAPTGERETYRFIGVGAEPGGDKWYTKASTSAAKFFVRRLFLMSAGKSSDDPDGSSIDAAPERQQQPRRQQQRQQAAPKGTPSSAQMGRLYAIANTAAKALGDDGPTGREIAHRFTWLVTNARSASPADLSTAPAVDKDGNPHPSEYDRVCAWIEKYPDRREAADNLVAGFIEQHPLPADDVAAPADEQADPEQAAPEQAEPEQEAAS